MKFSLFFFYIINIINLKYKIKKRQKLKKILMDTTLNISKRCEKLINELITNQDSEDFGTTLEKTLSHNYEKTLTKKFEDLLKKFKKIDANGDKVVTKDELAEFFQNLNHSLTKEDILKVFELFDSNKDEQITINEFIFSYIKLEEKLKIKKAKLINVRDNLNSTQQTYSQRQKNYINEKKNGHGISLNSEVFIQLLKIDKLLNENNINIIVEFIQKDIDDHIIKKSNSRIIKSSKERFNQDFIFKVNNPKEKIIINIYNKGYGNSLLGTITININEIDSQTKKDKSYEIKNENNPSIINGELYLKIRFRYDNFKYYDDLIKKTQTQIQSLNKTLLELDDYSQKLNQPFGLIVAQKANEIVQKNIMNRSEDPKDYIDSFRSSVYIRPGQFQFFRSKIGLNNK